MDVALLVIIHKGGFGAVHQREGVVGGLVPFNIIYAVSPVVIAGDDNVADKLFGTFIVEVLLAFLEKHVPWGKTQKQNTRQGSVLLTYTKRTPYFGSSTIHEHYRWTVCTAEAAL